MAAIIAACAGVIVWILHISASSLDATKQQDERRLLHVVVETQQNTLGRALEDYTNWKELYEEFEGPARPSWQANNVGPYLAATFDLDDVFVTTKTGKVVYAYASPRHYRPSTADLRTIAQLARLAFRIEPADAQRAATGFVSIHGSAALAVTATIRAVTAPVNSHFAVVAFREFDRAHIAKLSHDYGIAGLRAEQESGGITLRTPGGEPSRFHLVWRPSEEGHRLFSDILPVALAATAVALLAFAGVVFAWWRILEHMRLGEALILKAEIETGITRAEAAEETSRSKSAFIANMSHELRTPLNAIIGFSELIAAEPLGPIQPAKYREYISDIHASGTHLLRIIEDILHVSRIESGNFEPDLSPASIPNAVSDAVRMVDVIARKRGISLRVTGIHPLDVLVDSRALRQILINLLSNAVKFSEEGGVVQVDWQSTLDACEIRIKDQGCGISPETLARLGTPFVQAEHAYSRKYQGTGLGLAISFRLAEAMGGSIDVKSEMNVGTTVILSLPLAVCKQIRTSKATLAA